MLNSSVLLIRLAKSALLVCSVTQNQLNSKYLVGVSVLRVGDLTRDWYALT